MRLPQLTYGLALTLLCISLHHNIQEVQGSWAALGKVLFSGVTTTLSITTWATDGCLYFREICELEEDIPVLEAKARALTETLSRDANVLKELYESNVDLYNTIYTANVKNQRIIGNLQNIEKYSRDIIESLSYVSNAVDVPAIDTASLDKDVKDIEEEFDRVATAVDAIEKAASKKKFRDGIVRFTSLAGTGLWYAYEAYTYYKSSTPTGPRPSRDMSTQMSFKTAIGLRQKMNQITTFMAQHPRLSKAVNAAIFGTQFLMAGISIAKDVANANEFRQNLLRVKDDLNDIIADYDTTKAELTGLQQQQQAVQSEGEAEFAKVKQTFLDNTVYLVALRLSSSAGQDAQLQSVPEYTADNINQDNIIQNQNIYLQYLIDLVERHKSVYDRVYVIKFITEFVRSPSQTQNPTPLNILLTIAGTFDATATRDVVLYTIADALPNKENWPDMDTATGALTSVDLAPYRGVS